MKEFLAERVQEAPDALQGRHVAREYLQARILSSMQRAGAMIPLAFHGGTALRFLYQIPRYSEDLHFALEQAGDAYDLRSYLKSIRSDLQADTYALDLKVNDRRVVHSAFVRFRGLNNALAQTGWQGDRVTAANWRDIVWQRVEAIDWAQAIHEVQSFLINPPDSALLTKENMQQLLRGR